MWYTIFRVKSKIVYHISTLVQIIWNFNEIYVLEPYEYVTNFLI